MKRKEKQNIQWFCVASFIKVTFSKSKKLLFANGTLSLVKDSMVIWVPSIPQTATKFNNYRLYLKKYSKLES